MITMKYLVVILGLVTVLLGLNIAKTHYESELRRAEDYILLLEEQLMAADDNRYYDVVVETHQYDEYYNSDCIFYTDYSNFE